MKSNKKTENRMILDNRSGKEIQGNQTNKTGMRRKLNIEAKIAIACTLIVLFLACILIFKINSNKTASYEASQQQ